MKRIILLDKRPNFIQSVQLELMMAETEYQIKIESSITDTRDIISAINAYRPDELVVCANIIDTQPEWNFGGIVTRAYATSNEELNIIKKYGVECYGIFSMRDVQALLNAIDKDIIINANLQTNVSQFDTTQQTMPQPSAQNMQESYSVPLTNYQAYGQNTQVDMHSSDTVQTKPMDQSQTPSNNYVASQSGTGYGAAWSGQPRVGLYTEMPASQSTTTIPPVTGQYESQPGIYAPQSGSYAPQSGSYTSQSGSYAPQSDTYALRSGAYTSQPYMNAPISPISVSGYETSPMQQVTAPYGNTQNAIQQISQNQQQYNMMQYGTAVMQDIGYHNKRETKIVTIYSAKGGTGKTSISTALALALSRVPHKKNFYKVALVDLDIPFGGVSTVFGLNADPAKNISAWGKVIRNKVDSQLAQMNIADSDMLNEMMSKIANSLTFTKDEIKDYMIPYPDSGLEILPAPLTHQESFDLIGYEYDTILRNLRDCGEYDFIVCDTGNNTDDASSSALDFADTVYMVFTQDMTTIAANETFYNSMKALGLNTQKFKYIINKVRNDTAIAETDIPRVVPYQQVCSIKDTPAVTRANNQASPISNTNNDFSQGIRYIVEDITGIAIEENVKKKSFFSFLHKNK